MGTIRKFLKSLLGDFGLDPEDLNSAVYRGDVAAVQEALTLHPELVNVKNEVGRTPLHYAAWRGHNEMISLLVSRGADINAITDRGHTPLHLAVRRNYKETVALLIALGANVNARTKRGHSPMHLASPPLAALLRESGCLG